MAASSLCDCERLGGIYRGVFQGASGTPPKFSMPIRPAKPNPKNMPETTSFRTSGTCSASTRGLPRIIRRNVAPISAATKPVTRLLFFMHSPPAHIPAPNHCDRKAGIVSSQPARWNVTGEEGPTVNASAHFSLKSSASDRAPYPMPTMRCGLRRFRS